ncbi:MAG: hypothetical protein LC730_06510 [Acidobacteria bacterium]|nr:hypothetical protein [Acidobacteriota bacterium]
MRSTKIQAFITSRSPVRIRLRNDKQSIFRIGGCTNQVIVRNIELVGNATLLGESPRSRSRTYGVEAAGKWVIDAVTGAQRVNTSQVFRFENVVFNEFDIGLNVRNYNQDATCNPKTQACNSWHFDYIKVDHGTFINNNTGIHINTFNTDWNITNSQFFYMAAQAPGTGIRIERGGAILIQQSFGGGYSYGVDIGGTFLHIDTVGSLTIINSASERSQRSIYTAENGATSSLMLTMIGSVFGDKMELAGRINLISMGNTFWAPTVNAQPLVNITSVGDRFCYDPLVNPGVCKDIRGANAQNPGFNGGKIMFKTGRLSEGTGANQLVRQPPTA